MARGYGKPETRPTKVPTLLDIAWAAGIYEGEGNCNSPNDPSNSRMHVSQKDPEILYRLRDWFGGGVYKSFMGKGGPVDTIYKWTACGDRARVFAALIYGVLSARRRLQIDKSKVLDFMEGRSPEGLTMSELQSIAFEFTERRFKQTPHAIASRGYVQRKKQARILSAESYAPQERVM